MQINPALLEEVVATYHPKLDKAKWDPAFANKLLSQGLTRLGIDHVDLLEVFTSSTEQLYKPRDSHSNISGNQLAANIIHRYLREHLADIE